MWVGCMQGVLGEVIRVRVRVSVFETGSLWHCIS